MVRRFCRRGLDPILSKINVEVHRKTLLLDIDKLER